MATNKINNRKNHNSKRVRRIVQFTPNEHTFALVDEHGEAREFFQADETGQDFAPLADFVPVIEQEFAIALGPIQLVGGGR